MSSDSENTENDRKRKKSDTNDEVFDIEQAMLREHTYPNPSQKDFQLAVFKKREFHSNMIPIRPEIKNYADMKEFRDKWCSREVKLTESQTLVSNYINSNTPYTGILIYWGTGVGKTCAAIAIAEKFKPMVEKYGTRIHVLVPGPLNKQDFLYQIIKCTGETYLKMYDDRTVYQSEAEKNRNAKNIINIINQYYRIMSYSSFYKKVLGEKIKEKIIVGDKIKISNRKTETGEYDREVSSDRIYNLDNTLLIADEAHNLTGNDRGIAFKKIIESSKNLKIVLMSATPMKNFADEIVELINYLRPADKQMERDKIFSGLRSHQMEFKPGGREYLRTMVRGYISYLRGGDPLTFAERVDMGEIPPGLSFTKVTRCPMLDFQLNTYDKVIEEVKDDSLDRSSGAAANFVFPGLSKRREIEGFYGIEGINEVRSQLKNNAEYLNKKIAETVLKEYDIKNPSSLIYLTNNNKTISGDIFSEQYLKHFSIKFYHAIKNINRAVWGDRGPGLIFAYSNLVKVGIEPFIEVLQRNGYLEYQDNASNYNIRSDTKCYFCDRTFGNHKNLGRIPVHDFYPATFLSITGKTDDALESIPDEKHLILRNVFTNRDNRFGKSIKIIVGSRVINEGINMSNIKEIHILDVHFTLGRVDQVIGRGIRFCKHYDIISEKNPFPKVEIYKYVVSVKDGLTSEEELYLKAESKYKLIKETERICQEEALDCPLNMSGNVFPQEIEQYGDCGTRGKPCPAICGYMPCQFRCSDPDLNRLYWDPKTYSYRKLSKSELDTSTYSVTLATEEIEYAKSKIKEMYKFDEVYELREILDYVKTSYPEEKREMFDDYYVYQALDDMIPITNNDFNNFKDTVVDKFNRPGYLIYRGTEKGKGYYIFQLTVETEKLPMYYRKNYQLTSSNRITLKDYLQNAEEYKNLKSQLQKAQDREELNTVLGISYDFTTGQEYYDSREEFLFVGVIDRESSRDSRKDDKNAGDEFKVRPRRPKTLIKKRQTGVPSYKGAVCKTSKDKKFLAKLATKLALPLTRQALRGEICDAIRDKMFDLEKYSTEKAGNKMTYMIVPSNHPTIPFPLNLEDRVQVIIKNIQQDTRSSLEPKISTKSIKGGRFPDINYVEYVLSYSQVNDVQRKHLELRGAVSVGDGKLELIIK